MLMLLTISRLNAQGIAFEKGTFKEVLAKAKAEKKLLFMDCYTTWCGPCKTMSNNVFPQKQVGDYINTGFVSIKVDMEKGEGKALAAQYHVKAYPTMLFMNAHGEVIHRFTGAVDVEEFVKQAKIALTPSEQIEYLRKQFESGNRDLAMVSKYVVALQKADKLEEVAKVGEQVIPSMTSAQYLTEDGFTILAHTGISYRGKVYANLIDNKKNFINKSYIGEQGYDYVIGKAISDHLQETARRVKTLDELKMAVAVTYKDLVSSQQEMIDITYYGEYFLAKKQYDNWFNLNKMAADSAYLTDQKNAIPIYVNIAYNVAMNPNFDNAGLYDKAASMLENVKISDPESLAINYCLASLYLKTKNKLKARENINIFISKSGAKGDAPDERVTELKTKIENL